jgi:hypothetical protein
MDARQRRKPSDVMDIEALLRVMSDTFCVVWVPACARMTVLRALIQSDFTDQQGGRCGQCRPFC